MGPWVSPRRFPLRRTKAWRSSSASRKAWYTRRHSGSARAGTCRAIRAPSPASPCSPSSAAFSIAARLNESQVLRRSGGEDARQRVALQAVDARQESAQHRAIVVQHRIVAILEERAARHAHLLAGHAAACERAAEHPVDRAVAMIGAAVTVLAERAAELTDDDHHGVAPFLAHGAGEGG